MTAARQTALAEMVALAAEEKRGRGCCPAGHDYAGENLYVRPDGRRMCRACRRAQVARAELRRRLRTIIIEREEDA